MRDLCVSFPWHLRRHWQRSGSLGRLALATADRGSEGHEDSRVAPGGIVAWVVGGAGDGGCSTERWRAADGRDSAGGNRDYRRSDRRGCRYQAIEPERSDRLDQLRCRIERVGPRSKLQVRRR